MTVDLCPSVRAFEKEFFLRLVKKSIVMKRPIPVAISISGTWLLDHQDEFKWLKEQVTKNYLSITWVNHSYSHAYYPDLLPKNNFMLLPGTDFKDEILDIERQLLSAGECPSVFFRYPGLISDQDTMQQLYTLGLIPLGSDAWLAKLVKEKKSPTFGSIVLVHGNGNEPKGIEAALPLLDQFHWLPIEQAVVSP